MTEGRTEEEFGYSEGEYNKPRRGRPKGSKNRPKSIIGVGDDPVEPDYSFLDDEPEHVDRTNEPATVESWTAGPRGVRLLVRFRAAMSSPQVEEELDWPTGWPVPQLNDVIKTKAHAGRVQYVEYDHAAGLIIITAT